MCMKLGVFGRGVLYDGSQYYEHTIAGATPRSLNVELDKENTTNSHYHTASLVNADLHVASVNLSRISCQVAG